MSRAYTAKKKKRKRERDEANPERVRIRRLMRKGKLPRWKQEYTAGTKVVGGKVYHQRTNIRMQDLFRLLTETRMKLK